MWYSILLATCLLCLPFNTETNNETIFEAKQPPKIVSESQARCLAAAIWHEARGESLQGKIAIANVIFNRMALSGYPDTVCEIIRQPGQFTGLTKLKYDKHTLALAREILLDRYEQVISEATHFHNVKVKPQWSLTMEKVARIGNHVFYKEKEYE